MKKLIFLFWLAVFTCKIAVAQKEFNNWFFGNNAGLNFNSGAPVFLPGGQVVSDAASSSISDSQGNLLFYTDGVTVWDRNHQPMPNGTGLLGDVTSTQTVLITYYPGNKDLYFIFTVDKGGGPSGFRYSVVNMQLNSGLGDVDASQKNVSFNVPVTEKVTAIKNKNGIDLWLIFHLYNSNAFFVYSIDCQGKFFPKVYTIGSVISSANDARGYLKASPDGTKLVSANFGGDFEMFDFDNATGVISNLQVIPATSGNSCGPYGVEFSPDSKLLYVSEVYSCAPIPLYSVLQYRLDPSISNTIASRYFVDAGPGNLAGALQLGPDNKIYIAYNGATYLGVINNPGVYGTGCNLTKPTLLLSPATSSFGLPNVIAGFKRNVLASDTTVCDGAPLVLKLGFQNATYHWSDGSFADSLIVSVSGKYWVDIVSTDANGETCPISDTIKVIFQGSPKFSLGNDTLLCQEKFPLVLVPSPAVPAATYLWQDGSSTGTNTATGPGIYWLQLTANGCSARDSIKITSVSGTPFSLGADTAICTGDSLKLTSNLTAVSYLWNTGSTSSSINVKTAGVFWCEAKYANGCSYRDSIQVTLKPAPVVNLGKDTTICPNQFPYLLTQSITGAIYLWQDSSTANTFSVPIAGTYWLQATINGCSASDTVVVNANTVTSFNLGADTVICTNNPFVLTVNPAFTTYLWNTGSTSRSISVTASGLYWCEASNGTGCSYRDSIQVTLKPVPVVNLGNDTTICSNQFPYVLTQSITGASYLWQDGSTANTFSVPVAGTYWLQATINGCSARDTVVVKANTVTSFNLGADTVVCTNNSFVLTVNPAFTTYLWNTGSTSKSISVTASGLYWCEASNGTGCSYRDSIQVTLKPVPVVNLGKDTTICSNQFPYVLTQSITGASYLWQDGSTANTFSVPVAGTYWLQATINGCSASDTVVVNANTVTSFNLGADTVICTNNPFVLTVNPAFTTYLWNTSSTSRSISVTASGLYWCEASNGTGCSYRDSIQVTLKPVPVVNLGKDTTICSNQFPYVLTQSITGASCLWQDGSTANTFSVPGTGTYWLQATINGCSARDSIIVNANTVTSFNLGADTVLCTNNPFILTVNPAFTTYLWNTGSTSRNISVTASGLYWCEASNGTGCSYRDSIQVTLKPVPVVNLGKDTTICPSQFPYVLSQSIAGATYLWQDGSTANSFSVPGTGSYWLQATINGCSARDTVVVNANTVTSFNLGADTVICTNNPFVLTVNPAFNNYLWNTGSTSKSISVTASGLYWCEASNGTGCSYRDSIQVTLKPLPVVNLGKDTTICSNLFPYLLTQSITGASYLWQDGSTTNSLLVQTAGTYWLQATVNGCSARDTVVVNANTVTSFNLGADTVLCTNNPFVLTVNPAFNTYLWNTGSTSKSISVTTSGLYWCEASNGTGCSYRDSIQVTLKPVPVVNLGKDTTICSSQFPYLLTQSIAGATYLWQDGSTSNSFSVPGTGTYWLQATLNGCSASDTVIVNANTVTSFNLGADTVVCTNNPFVLTVNPAFNTYLWNTGSTSKSISVTTSGLYWCEASNGTGCSYRDSIQVMLKPVPVVNLGKDTTICSSQFPYLLTQSIAGATYLWQDGSTANSFSVPGTGTYWLQATINGCSASDTVIVNANTVTSFSLGADTVVCTNSPFVLTVNPAFNTYLWNTGSTSKSISVTISGLYWCEASNGTGCSYRDSIQVTLKPVPVVNLGKDTTICPSQFPYVLTQSIAGATYLWQDGSTSNSFSVPGTGTYWLQATINGCSASDTVIVNANTVTSFSLGADTVVCTNNPFVLTVNPAFNTYLWNTGSTSKSISVTTSGLYWCEASNGTGCSYRDSIQVTLKPVPLVNLGKDTTICSSQFPYLLTQSIAGATYLWQDGSTANSFSVSGTGTYWLQATINGCSASDTVNVSANSILPFDLGADTVICSNDPYILTVNPAFTTYLWNTGSTARSISVNTSGLYWCEASNGSGCTYRDSIRITLNPAPVVNLGNDTTLCQNQFPYILNQSIPGATYLWQDGTNTSTYTATGSGTYWLRATVNGCSATDSIIIKTNQVTSFSLGADTTFCAGNPLVLTAGPSFTKYLWNNGNTSNSISVSASGLYWCEAINSSGCAYRDSIKVTVTPQPVINLGNDTSVCSNAFPLTIGNPVTGASYIWQDGSTNATYLVLQPGLYWVEVSVNGCSSRDSINITSNPVYTFSLGADTSVCSNNPLTLKANITASNYLWNTGSTSQSIAVNSSGDYWCEINRGTGCSFRDSIKIVFTTPIQFSLGRDTVICDNKTLLLDVTNAGDSYTWQDNSKQSQYLVSKAGTYSVTVARGSCTKADTIVVNYGTSLKPDLGADKTICSGDVIILDAGVVANAYLWQDGSTGRTFKVTSPGTYSVRVTNECGSVTDEIVISQGACKIMIPNAFTPGKAANNLFQVLNAPNLKDFNLQVFNRWGQQVFQTYKSSNGWNGTYNGMEQPPGIYVYMLSYTDPVTDKKNSQKGTVVLVR